MVATSHFRLAAKMAHLPCKVSDRRCFRREHMSDFLRLFVVNEEGGYYLDADSFVVDEQLYTAFAACPFTMFSSVTESSYHKHINNGAFLGSPKNSFGAAWWQYFSKWDGFLWRCSAASFPPCPALPPRNPPPSWRVVARSEHSCGWPGRRASANPGDVHVAPAMLVPPPFLATQSTGGARPAATNKGGGKRKREAPRPRSYEAIDPNNAAARGVRLVHLTNWKVRPGNVTQPLLLAVLDRAMRLGGGWRPGLRTEPRRQCLNAVRRRVVYGR